jgi:ribosomal protein S27E
MQVNKTVLETHLVTVQCRACDSAFDVEILFARAHEQTGCPNCSATVVLGTSDITRQIKGIEKSLSRMEESLREMLGQTGDRKPRDQ